MEDGKAHCAPHASQESFPAMFTLYFRVTRTPSMILWGLAVVEFRRHVGLHMGSGLKSIYLNVFSCGVITLLLPRRYPLFSMSFFENLHTYKKQFFAFKTITF